MAHSTQNINRLGYQEVRSLALTEAEREWRAFASPQQELLAREYIGNDVAWLFFRNSEIQIPDYASLRKTAIIVSCIGAVRLVPDFRPDFNECVSNLRFVSRLIEEEEL